MRALSCKQAFFRQVLAVGTLVVGSFVCLCESAINVAKGQEPEASEFELSVFPEEIFLTTDRDLQRVIAQIRKPNGLTDDVTDAMLVSVANEGVAKWQEDRLVPISDGETTVTVSYSGASKTLPVKVERSTEHPPVSFKIDVMPVFMKTGCNQGSCHGAARGKEGFRLSLFGFDPDGDHHRLTREMVGRRVDLALPERSLLLEKGVGAVAHGGGQRIQVGDEYYATLLEWLKDGAVNDPGEVPTVVSVELFPKGGVLNGEGSTQKLMVRAKYSDGTDRDVTSLAYFSSNNDNSAMVSQDGLITATNRGEAFVMARFDTHTVGRQYITLPKDLQFQRKEIVANKYIDELSYEKLKKLRINPSDLCTDEEFLRRVSIDICGVLPTEEEYYAFMSDDDPNKRVKLVDALLDRKEFVEMWVMKWSELLQIKSSNQVSYKSMLLYYNWLQTRVADNVPIDQMVRELISSKGGTFANAATNYFQSETDTLKVAENIAQVFMGMRIQCAQCHNHPFDRWTMDDYYSFAAFFSQIGRKRGEDPRETIVFNSGSGEVRHLVGNRVMTPKFLGGDVPDLKGKDRREVLAGWLASAENPFFATNLSNVVWAHFFGRGIINDVDDVRVSNPAVNEELLQALAGKFTEYEYDFKRLVRDICTSRMYQLSTATNDSNASDTTNFSHASLRRVRAEVLLDMITQVTTTKNKFTGLPLGARAVQIADGNTSTYFLTTFGRASRETVCSCEVKMEPNLSQALHLLNGDTVQSKVEQGGLVKALLAEGKSVPDVVKSLYVRVLTREPTEKEISQLVELVASEGDQDKALRDAFWALLNSREFVFNH
ncbi:MAG: DUF1549 and DUF1553 domain-containing protein [Planctomycetota bacterium]|nr:DUF1549 and DUF1553 domain-containing protein [Planctomycetota bacterium]